MMIHASSVMALLEQCKKLKRISVSSYNDINDDLRTAFDEAKFNINPMCELIIFSAKLK